MQIDHPYISKYNNGLSVLLSDAADDECEDRVVKVWAGELNSVVRGPITEWAEELFESVKRR